MLSSLRRGFETAADAQTDRQTYQFVNHTWKPLPELKAVPHAVLSNHAEEFEGIAFWARCYKT